MFRAEQTQYENEIKATEHTAAHANEIIRGKALALKERREKERKIGEVVIKVCEWRSLYRNRALTLEDAAKQG